jgi:hypothetical protein
MRYYEMIEVKVRAWHGWLSVDVVKEKGGDKKTPVISPHFLE